MTARGVRGGDISTAAVILVLGAFIAAGSVSLDTPRSHRGSWIISLVFTVNTLLVLFGLFIEARRRPYSLNLFHLVALLTFVCVGGLYQYQVGTFPIAGSALVLRDEIPQAALSVLLWIVFYMVGYFTRSKLCQASRPSWPLRSLQGSVTASSLHLSMVISVGALAFLASLGFVGAFTRVAAGRALAAIPSSPLMLIAAVFVRAIPLVSLAGTLLAVRKSRGSVRIGLFPALAVLAAGVIATNNPLAAPRYWLVAVLVGFVAPHIACRFKTAVPVLLLSIAGLTLLPSLGSARHVETLRETVNHYIGFESPLHYLARSGDVDAVGMLALAIKWTDLNGHRWGLQILGAFLFWVPRSLWPGKPVGTGAMAAEGLGFSFTNYSVPIMTEPLVDFGLIGVPLFALAFGWFLATLDETYWSSRERGSGATSLRRLDIIYPFWAGMIVFVTRGDLMSSFAYTTGITLALFPLYMIPRRKTIRSARARPPLGGFPAGGHSPMISRLVS